MPKQEYKLKGEVYLWQVQGSWHFVNVTEKKSAEIKFKHGDLTGGFGSIPVEVTVGKTSWKTSIFWTKKGFYVLPLKKAVRKAEGIHEGTKLNYMLTIAM